MSRNGIERNHFIHAMT